MPADPTRPASKLVAFTDFGAPPGGNAPSHAQSVSRRLKVLVIDDNELNLIIASDMLQFVGHDACTAASGADGIAMCAVFGPDVVLMDLLMRGMNGCEASRRLRAMQHAGELPPFSIIGASADVDDDIRRECREAGMDEVIDKPLDVAVLRAQLERAAPRCSAR